MRALVLFIAAAFAVSAHADQGNPNSGQGDSFASGGNTVLAKSLISVASMHDMRGGRTFIEIAPGYWTGNLGGIQCGANTARTSCVGTGSFHGWALSGALKHEFSPHWGVGLLAGLSRGSGSITIANQNEFAAGQIPDAGYAGGTFKDVRSQFVGLQVTFDPFTRPGGFRLPLSFGPMLKSAGAKFDHVFTNPNTGKPQEESFDVWPQHPDVGFYVNASMEVPIGSKFRVMPGILVGEGGSQTHPDMTYNVNRNGVLSSYTVSQNNDNMIGDANVGFEWVPWNLTFNVDLPIGDLKTWTLYSLRWARTF